MGFVNTQIHADNKNNEEGTQFGKMHHITSLTLRRLISYIYMEHPFLMFLDQTQRRSTAGRTPLDE